MKSLSISFGTLIRDTLNYIMYKVFFFLLSDKFFMTQKPKKTLKKIFFLKIDFKIFSYIHLMELRKKTWSFFRYMLCEHFETKMT